MGRHEMARGLRRHARGLRGLPRLDSQVHTLELPLEQNPEKGWKPHHLFRGSTTSVAELGCHVSILDPGRQPHPPHRHAEEEILVVLDGETDLVLEDAHDRDAVSRHRVRRGTFAYYPTGFAHTIHNTSGEPVTYCMFKWSTRHRSSSGDLGYQLVPLPAARATTEQDPPADLVAERRLDGGTRCLHHLHSHETTLQPGAGYAPHADEYDVAIVTLDGVVETLGQRAGPNSVFFYPAGTLHGMHNVGDTPARYIVFEFHARRWRNAAPVQNQLRRARRLGPRAGRRR